MPCSLLRTDATPRRWLPLARAVSLRVRFGVLPSELESLSLTGDGVRLDVRLLTVLALLRAVPADIGRGGSVGVGRRSAGDAPDNGGDADGASWFATGPTN